MKFSFALVMTGLLTTCAACGTNDNSELAQFPAGEPAPVPETKGPPPTAEGLPVPTRAQDVQLTIPAAPRPEIDLPAAPMHLDVPERRAASGEPLGRSSQALSSLPTAGLSDGARQTLYVADGSGASSLGGYATTATIYNSYSGYKYWVSGPGTFNEEGYEILTNLASRMYWDCKLLNKKEAVIAGYSRGAYNVLESLRWAAYWGCAPTVRAALFIDPVDTLIWGYSHLVPDNAPTRIIRKDWWFNLWAIVFTNGGIYGGQQYIRESATTHPAFGFEPWVARDAMTYGNWFLGSTAFRF